MCWGIDLLLPYLLVQIYQLLVGQLERLDNFKDRVPVAIVDVRHEPIHAVDSVERHARLLLQTH